MNDWLDEKYRLDLEHDRNAPWWKAKRRPDNLFDHAPLFFTFVIAVWVIAGLIPAIAMLSKPVACAIGAAETWCPVEGEHQ